MPSSPVRHFFLCLALVASTSLSWRLPFFNYNQDQITLHPQSPPEADPLLMRAKRQAYQLSDNGDAFVTVDKYGGGQPESGVWGPWNKQGDCSRTCGGGVQTEKRQCNGDCTGASVRYQSCNLQECPEEAADFRAEQCAKHNDDPLDGKYHKWVPYKGTNKCELTCKPEQESYYYKWADQVVDGTKCDQTSDDICVDGVCLPLGCDGKLGSVAKADKCGVCNGSGNTCKSQEGLVKEAGLSQGYNDIIVLPVGATAIRVEETRQTSNSLAIKTESGNYSLNGNNFITLGDQDVKAGGTVFKYQKPKPESGLAESLTAKGPLEEPLIIQLLYQGGANSKGGAVKYQFSTPLDEDVQFIYKPAEWSACSVTCGKGVHTRALLCTDTKSGQRVEEDVCEANNATKPDAEKACQTVDCAAEWFVGEWEECSESCGDHGLQYRVVYCHQVFANGKRITVEDGNCTSAPRPAVRQTCNRHSCPEWHAGPWSACSEKCGDAKQYRSVTCRSEKEGEEGKLLPAEHCPPGVEIDSERGCNLGPCEGLHFVTSDWDLCERCTDTEETRNVTCQDQTGRPYPLEKCLDNKTTEIPPDTRTCATALTCFYQWHVTEWGNCSTECGHGHKSRKVHCALNELGTINIVEDSLCSSVKPNETEECINEVKCTGTWYSGPWDNCTKECDGGKQSRLTVCLNYDKKPVPEWCDESNKPVESQDCNIDPCPTCDNSTFGCCPDNITFALGDWFEGCSNCSLSDFGCCADNVTQATGADFLGCPEYVEPEPGSGEEAAAEGEEDKECEVTSESGDIAKVLCSASNASLEVENLLLGNETEEEGNATKHCSKTEFGCCPDWYTPAEGKDYLGCPEFVLGACNETEFGCCVDNVTLARGPNFEGCGEPVCAGSRFGCCKDRKTIAFGPHYAGCERSAFPCENSQFGCCPDGETGALDKNGTGCGVDCLLTKFGCCPDGVTVSKGSNNEGCGCEFSQYGCCPDGKSAAKGAGYYGCPDSCAQSQYGCCPDGKTAARGPQKEGCPCQYTRWGCCPDGETAALGPKKDGCDNCHYAKYGCCDDGTTKALGLNKAGCPTTTRPPAIVGGTVAPAKIIACNLPQDKGELCHHQYALQWFYDSTEGRCSQFWFGGCAGNQNRFPSKEECEVVCVEPPENGRCYLPKVEGPQKCNNLVPRYWYDYTTKRCDAFWWRGCLGNANNFESWDACVKFCADVGPTTTPAPPTEDPYAAQRRQHEEMLRQEEQRRQPQPASNPRADVSRAEWETRHKQYLDQQKRARVELEQTRFPSAPAAVRADPVCGQLVDSGDCDEYQNVWYYSQFSQECFEFIYTGCNGNENRFQTRDACLRRCGQYQQREAVAQAPALQATRPSPAVQSLSRKNSRESCYLPKDIGRCQGHFDSYFYDPATDSCELFQYSGCGGNANRFHNKEQCVQACARTQVAAADTDDAAQSLAALSAAERCEAPPDKGPCTHFQTMWFFKKTDGTCTRFYYGGCQGNGNLFKTEQECKNVCGNYLDVCSLPPVKGPCGGRHQKFHYDKEARECKPFEFSGCLGNSNNFNTKEQCDERCAQPEAMSSLAEHQVFPANSAQICSMPKATGPCRAMIRQFHYDIEQGRCRQFVYGGCAGNANRFESRAACMSMCEHVQPQHAESLYRQFYTDHGVWANGTRRHKKRRRHHHVVKRNKIQTTAHNTDEFETVPEEVTVHPQKITDIPELCLAPEDRGPCHGSILRWHFNPEKGDCDSFLYTGCQGNANNFMSKEACGRACGQFRQERVCTSPKSEGGCQLKVPKWFYDQNRGECFLFWWTGCGGNGNRFSSKEECENLCKAEMAADEHDEVCELEKDSGPCQDPITQWYHDVNEGLCKKFTFGGCRGNANRFNSKADCDKRCRSDVAAIVKRLEPKDVCAIGFDAGPCGGVQKKWFFDMNMGTCRSFTYGGCKGNANRFDSELDCFNLCKAFVDMKRERRIRAHVQLSQNSPFHHGDTVRVRCLYGDADRQAVWFVNDTKLDELKVDWARYQLAGDVLAIQKATPSDGGLYSCSAGPSTLLSEPKMLVIEGPPSNHCEDRGSSGTCTLVLRSNLCSNSRYRSFCCKTCTETAVTRR